MAKERHFEKHVRALIVVLAAWIAWGHSDAPLEFEAVSIKPSLPAEPSGDGPRHFGCRGGPESTDPGLVTCSQVPAGALVRIAYGMGLRVSYTKCCRLATARRR